MIRDKVIPEKRDFAKKLRRDPTAEEVILWERLRCVQLGVKFRRQTIIRGYIVDFYCPKIHLVVEVDGDSHIGRECYDEIRDRALANLGIETIRFTVQEVAQNCEHVVLEIKVAIQRRSMLQIRPFHGPTPEYKKQQWLQIRQKVEQADSPRSKQGD